MRLFSHSLIGKEKYWYLDQPVQIMTNWKLLKEKFLNMFFLHNKFLKTKTTITIFSQDSTETLCEAWEHQKTMFQKFRNHGFDDLTQIYTFYKGLQS